MQVLQPKLRFPEFLGDWERTTIGEIGTVKMCKRIFNEQTTVSGEIPFFKIGSFGKNADAFIPRELFLEFKNKFSYPKKGDILISAAGTIGRTVIYDGSDAYFQDSNIVWIDNDNSKVLNQFLFFIFQIVKFNTEGGTIQRLYNNILKSTSFKKPSLEEQTKIASFLTEIDTKLNQLTQKKNLLEQYKKGVMQKIFNQEIRFKDDNGNDFAEWEEKRLGQIADFYKGKGLPKNAIVVDGKFKCVHYGELFTKYSELINEVESRTSIDENVFFSKSNDVLMPTSDVTPNGLATASCLREDNVILGGDILVIRQKKVVLDGLFFAYYVHINREKVMKLVSGSTVYHLYGSDMKNLDIQIPCMKEQTKIANFLSAIDEQLNQVSKQIEQTTQYKKGLLQQMFV